MNSQVDAITPYKQRSWRYTSPAILLHWISALLLVAIATIGWYMMSVEESIGSEWYFAQHKSLGLVFALLVIVRLIWRQFNRPDPLPTSIPKWQVLVSQTDQVLLYVLIVIMPITGYLGASFSKSGVLLFGARLPQWALPNHDWAETLFDFHSALIWVLIALVSIHILGALKHLIWDKDGIFQRMWFKP